VHGVNGIRFTEDYKLMGMTLPVTVFVQVFLNKVIQYDENLTRAFDHKSTMSDQLMRADRLTVITVTVTYR